MDAVLARVSRGDPDLDGVDPRLAPLLHAALSPRAGERPHRDEVVRPWRSMHNGGDVTDVIRPAGRTADAGADGRFDRSVASRRSGSGTPTPAPPLRPRGCRSHPAP